MSDVPLEGAIARAREALSLATDIPARAEYVARLDRPGTGYYLVEFGAEEATIAVAAVDADRGEVLSQATLPGTRPQLTLTAAQARRRAGGTDIETPRLVWRPSRASFSIFSPLWEVMTPQGLVFVDQQGTL